MKVKYQTQRVSAGEYQVIDVESKTEYALCCEFEGESKAARDRAVDIAVALFARDKVREVLPDVGCEDATDMMNYLQWVIDNIDSAGRRPQEILDYISRTQSAKARIAQAVA